MDKNKELTDLIVDVREQLNYLNELGVETLEASLLEMPIEKPAAVAPMLRTEAKAPPQIPTIEAQSKPKTSNTSSRLNSLPSLSRHVSTPPKTSEPKNESSPAAKIEPSQDSTIFGDISGLPESTETMEQIWADIGNCTRCPLHEGRTQVVHTVGNYNADLMFIGEAPGADEDAKGEPFVGRAGQLLTKIIEAIGMKREEVCIGNINRCRPPGNRQPTLPEAHTCKPFLLREIAVIRPKVIVVMGNTALHNLLDTKVGITRMRGQFHEYYGVKVMPTFHPAYLLRDPSKKREVWDDMKTVRDYLTSLENK